MENPPIVVTGQLVEEPNVKLAKWTKVIAFVYFMHSAYMFVQYNLSSATEYQWISLLLTTFIFAFWLPLCGYQSSKKPGSGRLALFTGVQSFLSCWNIFSLISMWMFIMMIVSVCQVCEPVFKAGNKTCLVDSDSNKTVEIAVDTCSKPWPSDKQLATSVMLLCMTLVSCVGALLARKTVKSKTTHIITVGTVHVSDTYQTLVVPPVTPEAVVPEDSVA
jgi:hypothetical protein